MKDFLKKLKLNESNISMGLGILVVITVGVLLVNYFRSVNKTAKKGEISPTATSVQIPSLDELPKDYAIQVGDSLWKISEKVYGTGYNWVDIYAANKQGIKNPDKIFAGAMLTLPKVEPRLLETEKPVIYTVVPGDNLWAISSKLCGNGYVWSKVATQNNLSNPHLIKPGQVLKINCK